jgi:hypothetical protein
MKTTPKTHQDPEAGFILASGQIIPALYNKNGSVSIGAQANEEIARLSSHVISHTPPHVTTKTNEPKILV